MNDRLPASWLALVKPLGGNGLRGGRVARRLALTSPLALTDPLPHELVAS
jgi:hypothetical protein